MCENDITFLSYACTGATASVTCILCLPGTYCSGLGKFQGNGGGTAGVVGLHLDEMKLSKQYQLRSSWTNRVIRSNVQHKPLVQISAVLVADVAVIPGADIYIYI